MPGWNEQGGRGIGRCGLMPAEYIISSVHLSGLPRSHLRHYMCHSSSRTPADIRSVCVSAGTQKAPNLLCCFLKRRLTNTPRHRHPADGQLSSLCPTLPSFSSFGAACAMLGCSLPVSSNTPLRASVYNANIRFVVNIAYIRKFCDHLIVLYIFDQSCIVLKSG